jgi:tetratricopeptide (TPR) repeat protein
MKYFLGFIVGVFILISCSEKKEITGPEFAFNQSWNNDSIPEVRALREMISIDFPRSPEGLYCKAWLSDQKGNTSKALKTADSLVMGFPSFEKGFYLRANLRTNLKDEAGALSDFGNAIKRNPTFFEAYVNRGGLHFQTKHYDLSLKDFIKANQIKPNQNLVLYNIGNAFLALGQFNEACSNLKKADSLGNKKARELVVKYCEVGN